MASKEEVSVRWMHKGQKDKWIPFCGNDSIRLEIEHRSLSSQRPRAGSVSSRAPIAVRDGMYVANVKQKICTPTYWEGTPTLIIRGTWFVETSAGVYQPVLEEEAAYIERYHWSKPLRNKLREGQDETDSTRSSKASREPLFTAEPVSSSSSSKCVVWYAEDDVWLNTKDITHQVTKSVASLFGNKKKGELVRAKRLRRGWHTEPDPDDMLPVVNHLFMVVHGIGQSLDSTSIVTCAKGLSETALQELYADASDGKVESRVEFIPVEWRTSLALDGGLLDRISPAGISQIRRISQLAVCDILYYMSPLYGSEFVDSVLTTMNRQYRKYVEHHPWFVKHGRVSILAHSLGSVITYDILASQAWGSDTRWVGQRPSCGEQLDFPVENFFAIGSPLSLFLGMRGAGSDSKVPGGGNNPFSLPNAICKRMFNIYHPSDPVAFRWEPLILQKYVDVKPVKVSRDSHRRTSSLQSSDSTDGAVLDRPAAVPSASSSKSSSLFGSLAGAIGTALTATKLLHGAVDASDGDKPSKRKGSIPESSVPHDKRLPERYDFALKESFIESASQYLQAITAHTSYWNSTEVLRFLLAH